jgi:hypothetical protein
LNKTYRTMVMEKLNCKYVKLGSGIGKTFECDAA